MLQKIKDINRAWSVRRRIVVGGVAVLMVVGLFSCSLSSNSAPAPIPPPTPTPVPTIAPTSTPPPTTIPSPTATHSIPIPMPTAANAPEPAGQGLGVSVADFQVIFVSSQFTWKPHPVSDGTPYAIGQARQSYVAPGSSPAAIHLIGDPYDLTEVNISVDMDGNRSLNSVYLEAFLDLTMPEWERRFDWIVESIKKHGAEQRINTQTTTYNGKWIMYTFNRRSGLAGIVIRRE